MVYVDIYWDTHYQGTRIKLPQLGANLTANPFSDAAKPNSDQSNIFKTTRDIPYNDLRRFDITMRNDKPHGFQGWSIDVKDFLRFVRHVCLKIEFVDEGDNALIYPFMENFEEVVALLEKNQVLLNFEISVDMREEIRIARERCIQTTEQSRYLIETLEPQIRDNDNKVAIARKALEKVERVLKMRVRDPEDKTQNSDFLRLPTEMRLQIFNDLSSDLSGTDNVLVRMNGDANIRESTALADTTAVMLTCRQLNNEMRDMLYNRTHD